MTSRTFRPARRGAPRAAQTPRLGGSPSCAFVSPAWRRPHRPWWVRRGGGKTRAAGGRQRRGSKQREPWPPARLVARRRKGEPVKITTRLKIRFVKVALGVLLLA